MMPETILEYFASNPLSPIWSIDRALCDSPIIGALSEYLEGLPHELVCQKMADPHFGFMYGGQAEGERNYRARIELLREDLEELIPQLRLAKLRVLSQGFEDLDRPHLALSYFATNEHGMVNLNSLKVDGHNLVGGNGFDFRICLSLPGLNSMWWLEQALYNLPERLNRWVRLDPLLIQPSGQMQQMAYRMWVFGRSPRWEELASATKPIHGRWMPEPLTREDVAFTDFIWDPRKDGVHVVCEEVPRGDVITLRGSRYLHAVYLPQLRRFNHVDGAIRIFDSEQIEARLGSHVQKAGKIGLRIKLFQVDGEIDEEQWLTLTHAFFVWNQDVVNYFVPK